MARASAGGRRPPPGSARRRVRLADIAGILGVSEATVSRALRDDPQISGSMRQAVQAVAADLEYVPNRAARSLASSASESLGLLVPDVTDPMHGLVVAGFEAEALDRGYSVMVMSGARDLERESRGMRELRAHQADGVALYGTITDPAAAVAGVGPGHAVFIAPEVMAPHDPRETIERGCLTVDDAQGIRDLVVHLHQTGHVTLSYVGATGLASERVRRRALAATLEELGREPRIREYGPVRAQDDYVRVVSLVRREHPDALVCYDDRVALTLMASLRDGGIRVPQDVAVSGFDDIPFARLANPQLTTVAQPAELLGRRAAAMLVEAIMTGELPPSERHPVRLVVRQSSLRARRPTLPKPPPPA